MNTKWSNILFKQIDNSALIVFRVFFGVLICLEAIGAIFTGWVHRAFIEPSFTFTFIGFEWLQPLPGYGMYIYYGIMGVLGLFVALGLFYRFSIGGFTILWTITYLMQKSSYNNHYYLLILICVFMWIVPAHRYKSLDVKHGRVAEALYMPQWVSISIILQIFIMYTYAAIAKIYPGWLDLDAIATFMAGKRHYVLVGEFLQEKALHYFLAFGGLFFDLLVAIGLLYKPTRKFAFGCAVFFHLFNSVIFQVGIFPFLGLAFCLFFFDTETIRKIFLKKKSAYTASEVIVPQYKNFLLVVGIVYFAFQIGMPLRHWVIPGDVLYTEEGHRMSWRMMLRAKASTIQFKVEKEDGTAFLVKPNELLSSKQARVLGGRPDMIWQFAQYLAQREAEKGAQVKVYAIGMISVNRKGWHEFIDPTVDLASERWSPFKHHTWIRDIQE